MFTSLFGDLGTQKDPPKSPRSDDGSLDDDGFAATTILKSASTVVNDQGQMVDRLQQDIVVTGSPADAIRTHFAMTRADMDVASRLITLIDPVGLWASAVIKALSDAGGRPIERLHLREHTTLRTIATIERTTLVRRHEDTLKIYHADVRVHGRDNADIPMALMERSHLTTVIVGPMPPQALDSLLAVLKNSAEAPTWRCPSLLFMLAPNADWIAAKIKAVRWPQQLKVHVVKESMASASSVWNAMLGMWNQLKAVPMWQPADVALGVSDFPIKVADLTLATPLVPSVGGPAVTSALRSPNQPTIRLSHQSLDSDRTREVLAEMLTIDGLVACAAVDATTGMVVARQSREGQSVDIDLCAAASAQVLQAHRAAARSMGLPDRIDEIVVSAGQRQHVLRAVARHPDLFLMSLLDKQCANLALARYKLMEVENALML